jgi:hypothetical protein
LAVATNAFLIHNSGEVERSMSSITGKLIATGRLLWLLIGWGTVLVGVVTLLSGGIGDGVAYVLFGGITILLARWFFNRLASEVSPAKANPGSSAASSDEDLARLYDQCSSGNFPAIANPPVNLKSDEIAHHACPVEVRQLKTETTTYRGYAGTRVKIGDLPVYLGGSVPQKVSREVLATVGKGNFVVTNKRVVLSGTKVNYSIGLDQINDLELFSDAIQIMNEGRNGGRFYMMDDPRRAAVILDILTIHHPQ